jgi:hypothetical protein
MLAQYFDSSQHFGRIGAGNTVFPVSLYPRWNPKYYASHILHVIAFSCGFIRQQNGPSSVHLIVYFFAPAESFASGIHHPRYLRLLGGPPIFLNPIYVLNNRVSILTCLQLLESNQNPELNIIGCDYSSKAIEVVKVRVFCRSFSGYLVSRLSPRPRLYIRTRKPNLFPLFLLYRPTPFIHPHR